MAYLLWVVLYLVWLVSVGYRWPVTSFELLTGWLIGGVGCWALAQKYPAKTVIAHKQRVIWFLVVVTIGLLIIFL